MSLPDPSTVIEQLRRRNPTADPLRYLPDVHPVKIPRHVAIIINPNSADLSTANERRLQRIVIHEAPKVLLTKGSLLPPCTEATQQTGYPNR
jgi:hypothetical protein